MKKILIFFLAILFMHCATTGPGGKKSLILVSTQQEISIGKELVKQVEKQGKVVEDSVVNSYVSEIGNRIAKISDRPDLDYAFKVLADSQINAFACPGGFVYVYSGLLKKMDNEAQLAGVLAHEISHVVARHSVQRLQEVLGLQMLISVALGKESHQATEKMANTGLGLILQGYGRQNEFEADKFGTYYMAQAGYNPSGMLELLTKLSQQENGKPSGFEGLFASHPQTEDRIKKVKEQVSTWPKEITGRSLQEDRYRKVIQRLK